MFLSNPGLHMDKNYHTVVMQFVWLLNVVRLFATATLEHNVDILLAPMK